jgi:hypothetical protein
MINANEENHPPQFHWKYEMLVQTRMGKREKLYRVLCLLGWSNMG